MSAVLAAPTGDADAELFLVKTEKGQDEIRNRSFGLNPRLRSLLVMIDGTRPVAEIVRCAAGLGGGVDFVQSLLDGGFVRPRTPGEADQADAAPAGPVGQATAAATPANAATPAPNDPERVARGKAVLRRFIKLAPLSDARALNRAVDAVHGLAALDGAARVVADALSAAGNSDAAVTMRTELARD